LIYQHGIMGVKWHRPTLPGLGNVMPAYAL
jgi:hypothetical protein